MHANVEGASPVSAVRKCRVKLARGGIGMEDMTRKIVLAALLGVLVGAAVGYCPRIPPNSAPRAQLFMQPTGQSNAATFSPHATFGLTPVIVALLVGLGAAAPVFLIARRRVS